MKAMLLERITTIEPGALPLRLAELPTPSPGPGEVLVAVRACGVCHTELDEIEGRTPPPRLPVVPGHEVVGHIAALGEGVSGRRVGERVGVGWIHASCGGPEENLSDAFVATGRDVNGGYAEYLTVPAPYAVALPEGIDDLKAAPLLCAGAIGYRALKLTGLENGQRLGLTGFGGSAHLVLQLARHLYPASAIYVFARDAATRTFAAELGADWVGPTEARPPQPLHAIIDTTPAWLPVVSALAALEPGGRLVINAIRKENADREQLLKLSYHEHLWLERELKSVANITRDDIAEFLPLAVEVPLDPTVQRYPLEAANEALVSLKLESVQGAKVLEI